MVAVISRKLFVTTMIWLSKCLLVSLFLVQLAGCSSDLHREIMSREEGQFVLKVLAASKSADGGSLEPLLNSELQKDSALVKRMTDAVKRLSADDMKLEAFLSIKERYALNALHAVDVRALFLRQPRNADGYIAEFVIQNENGTRVLSKIMLYEAENMSVVNFASQLRSIPSQIVIYPGFALLAASSLALTVAGTLVAVFGKDMNHRWAWALLSLFGIGIFTTGSNESGWGVDFLSIISPPVMLSGYKLLAFGFYLEFPKSSSLELTPMGLYFSIPLGAIITLAVWDDLRRMRKTQ